MAQFLDMLHEKSSYFSGSQRKISSYIENNLSKASYLRANEMARLAGVSGATVVRFSQLLGYDGYAEMQKDIQELTERLSAERNDPVEVITTESPTTDFINMMLRIDQENLRVTYNRISKERLDDAVSYLQKADRVVITGVTFADSLYSIVEQQLYELGKPVVNAAFDSPEASNIMESISERDAIICIALSANSPLFLDLVMSKKKLGTKVIVVSDQSFNDYHPMADVALHACSKSFPEAISLTATISLMNTIMFLLKMRTQEQAKPTFGSMWVLQEDFSLYQ